MDEYNDGMLEETTIIVSFGTPDGFILGIEEGNTLGSIDGEMLSSSLGSAHGIELGIDEETELGSSDGSCDGSNEGTVLGSSHVALEVTRYGILRDQNLGSHLDLPMVKQLDRMKASYLAIHMVK